jgi:hypothetical protein
MIRKTFDGKIERFDVDGGRVIDDNGAWAYQIMNLDYMITSEDGTLIYSQDPNIGIATRSSVRFNIGMDDSGGDGRLRTRARYLVPNNPTDVSQIMNLGLTLKKLVSEIYIGIKFTQFQIIYLDFNQITVWKIGILLVLKVWMNVLVIKHHSHIIE